MKAVVQRCALANCPGAHPPQARRATDRTEQFADPPAVPEDQLEGHSRGGGEPDIDVGGDDPLRPGPHPADRVDIFRLADAGAPSRITRGGALAST